MSRWFRHYAGLARDDKLVRAAIKSGQPVERVVWVWIAILESASEIDDRGRFEVEKEEIGRFLRCPVSKVAAILFALEELGRITADSVAKWTERQFQSDRSASRMKAHRERHRDGKVTSRDRHGDAPETDTETDTETEKEEQLRDATASGAEQIPFAFAGQVIRLNRPDLDRWRQAYSAIPDLNAELVSLDAWLRAHPEKAKTWFHTVSGALNRKHQEWLAQAKKPVEAEWNSPC